MVKHVVTTLEHTFVHTVEDLMDFTLIEIEKPLGLIPDAAISTPPTSNYSETGDSQSKEEGYDSKASIYESRNIGDINKNKQEGNNQPGNNQPWFARDALVLPIRLHNLPRNPEKLLPKFDPETYGLP